MYRVELTKQREGLGNQVEEMQGKDLKKKKKRTHSSSAPPMLTEWKKEGWGKERR